MYQIYDLKCNHMKNPVGIEERPIFSWRLRSDRQNVFQQKHRIRVWTEEETLLWDSGYIQSTDNTSVAYQGPALKTGRTYRWEAQSISCCEEETALADASFTTGILEKDFWQAKWIAADQIRKPVTDVTDAGLIFAGKIKSHEHPEEFLNPPVCFRRRLQISRKLKKASAYATARGIYTLRIDQTSIQRPFAPEYTVYKEHLEYQWYDITALLPVGSHELRCLLADGWYTGKIGLMGIGNQYGDSNALLLQIVLEYEDGTTEIIISDEQFEWALDSYLYADLFVGEYLDYTKPEAACWKHALVKEYGYANLKGTSCDPVGILRKFKPASCIRTPKGEWVLDAGENISGYTCFRLRTEKQVTIGLEHSEVLDKDGNFLQNILGQNKNQKDIIVCPENTLVQYEPAFTFHGFRYVKVTGLEHVNPDDFTIVVLGTDLEKTGTFQTSDDDLNQLQANIFRSQQGNMFSVPTDCPQRERAGWTGDMQVYTRTAAFNMDVYAFLKRWLQNMRLEQKPDGQIPHVIPDIDSNKYIDGEGHSHISSAGWADACVIVPYDLYMAYGRKEILEENFSMMTSWMSYVQSHEAEWPHLFHFGDWLIPSILAKGAGPMETASLTREYVAPAMYAYTTGLMIDICTILGRQEEAAAYARINQRIRDDFSDKYISEDGHLPVNLQGPYVLALQMKMIRPQNLNHVVNRLVELIRNNDYCLDTGFLSVPFLLDVLCDYGCQDTAYRILLQKKAPSWLYAIEKGATTIWENWTAILPDGTPTTSSYNHFSFGCVGGFLYRKIAGIQIEEPGYRKIRIAPDLDCGMDSASASLQTPYGLVTSCWEKKDGSYHLSVTLPPNTEGVIVWKDNILHVGNGTFCFD